MWMDIISVTKFLVGVKSLFSSLMILTITCHRKQPLSISKPIYFSFEKLKKGLPNANADDVEKKSIALAMMDDRKFNS